MKQDLILLKLGGSLITDKSRPYTARRDVIDRLAKEIHEARPENKKGFDLIVGHGGGSFPHNSAVKHETQKGIVNESSYRGIAEVQRDAATLNRIVVDSFLKAGENAISVQPSSATISKDSRIKSWDLTPLKLMLGAQLLPVPYGDVGLDLKKGCCILSTEEVLFYIARKLNAKRTIIVGKTDGVFAENVSKKLDEINPKNFGKIRAFLAKSDGIDVTGGMLHKVERLLELAKYGIPSEIINGNRPGFVGRALAGEKGLGTLVRA